MIFVLVYCTSGISGIIYILFFLSVKFHVSGN
jgi:hypothetical protein